MSAENPPYAIQADSHGAELFRLAIGSLLPRGVGARTRARGGIVNAGDLAVTAGTGNTLNIAAGEAWIPGNQGAHQGLYYGFNDAIVNVAVTPNGSNPLYAVVTASVNDQAYSGNPGVTNNQWGFLVTQGTPGSSPAVPTVPNNSLVLATVLVPASASSSSAYTIYPGVLSGSAGLGIATIGDPAASRTAAATQTVAPNTVTTVTVGTVDFLRGGFTTASNGLVVPVSGVYRVTTYVNWSAFAGVASNIDTYIAQNGSAVVLFSAGTPTGSLQSVGGSKDLLATAGDTFTILCNQNSSSNETINNGNGSTFLTIDLVSSP